MNRVLVVDDVQDNIALLTFDLEDDGFEVIEAYSGQECLDLARDEYKPDIILLDIHMPGISGIETLKKLKSQASTCDIPVIMVSANNSDANIIEAIDIGAHDFVSKPIEYPVLAARMRSALRLSTALADLERANEELNKLATKDPLTESYNRRYFFTLSQRETTKAERHIRDLSVLMIDIDHFKAINDTYGHASGDLALVKLAENCREMCRESDIFGRIGGEEFAMCCPDTNLEGAHIMAERIRHCISELEIEHGERKIKFTLSIGVTQLKIGESFDDTLHRADEYLYLAKNNGRNRVEAGIDSPGASHSDTSDKTS